MPTFIPIKGPKGTRWKALVRRKRAGRIVYSRARTFSRRALAASWAAGIEAQLEDPAKMERAGSGPTVGDLIRRYIREVDEIRPLGRSHRAGLQLLLNWPLAGKRARGLRSGDIVEQVVSQFESNDAGLGGKSRDKLGAWQHGPADHETQTS